MDLNVIHIYFNKINFITETYTDNRTLYDSNKKALDYCQTSLKQLQSEHDILQGQYNNPDIDKKLKSMLEELNKIAFEFNQSRSLDEDTSIFKYVKELVSPMKDILKKYEYTELDRCVDTVIHSLNMIKKLRADYIGTISVDLKDLRDIDKFFTGILNKYSKYLNQELFKTGNFIDEYIKLINNQNNTKS